jgi:hypothetical protein
VHSSFVLASRGCSSRAVSSELRARVCAGSQGHKWVREVDVLSRHIDDQGRLHSTRLLSLSDILKSPLYGKIYLGNKLVH